MADSDFDMPALMQEASAQAARITGINNQIQALMPTTEAVDNMVSAILSGTDRNGDTPYSLQTRELGALEAQQKKQEFYKQLGKGQGYAKVATDLSTQFYQAMEEAKVTAQSVADRKAVGLFDNPLAWAINQVILPDEEAALSGQLSLAKVSADQLSTLTKMSDDEARIENEFATKLTAASIDSKVKGLAANLQVEAMKSDMAAKAQNVHTLAAVMNAQGEQLRNIKYVIDAKHSAASLAFAEKNYQIRSEEFAAWKKENADKQEFADQMTQFHTIGADILGKPKLTTNKIQMLLKMGGTAAAEAQALIDLGFQNLNQGEAKLGVTPIQVVDVLQKTKGQIPDHFSKLVEYGFATVNNRAKSPTDPLDTKNPAAVSQVFNEAVKAKALEYQSNIDYRDQTNPYILPPPKILADNPDISSTRFYQKVLAPLVANGALDTSDPNKIVALGLEAVKNGTITYKDLSEGVTTYYDTGRIINAVGRNFYKHAIPVQPGYKTQLEIPSIFGESAFKPRASVDLADLVSFNSYLSKVRSSPGGLVQGY